MKKLIVLFLSLTVFFPTISAKNNQGTSIAIKARKIVTVSGNPINNGIILIKGDKIQQLGSGIPIPPGYKLYDYSDGVVYPGLINSMSNLGISGISAIGEWNDYREVGKFNPQISASTAFYPWSNLIPNTRDFGTLIVLSAPQGGIICGKALLAILHGWTPGDMFIKREAAMMIILPEPEDKSGAGRRRALSTDTSEKDKIDLHKFINNAYKYYLRSAKGQKTVNFDDFNPKFEAMKPLWAKRLPVIISARCEKNIRFALKLGKEFNLNMILHNIYDGENVLKEIKASGHPVILGSMYARNKKWEDGYDKVFRLPALLADKGIPFAFSADRAAHAFDLPVQAGRAVAYGLSPLEAVKALTLYPARIFGIQGESGSLEPGKIANLLITDGNILETSTVVKDVFIKGKKITAKSFYQKEFQRSRDKISGETR